MGQAPFHRHRQRVEEPPGIVILPTRRRNQQSNSGDSVGGGGSITNSSSSSSITYETLITALYHQCPTALLGSPGAEAMARSFFQPRNGGSVAQSHHDPLSESLYHNGTDSSPVESVHSSHGHVMKWIPQISVTHRERVSSHISSHVIEDILKSSRSHCNLVS